MTRSSTWRTSSAGLRLNRTASAPRPFQVVLAGLTRSRAGRRLCQPDRGAGVRAGLFLDGLAGSFFRPLAIAYILAILASLLVALTVTPALSYMLLSRVNGRRETPPLAHALQSAYGRVLPALVSRLRAAAGCWS